MFRNERKDCDLFYSEILSIVIYRSWLLGNINIRLESQEYNLKRAICIAEPINQKY